MVTIKDIAKIAGVSHTTVSRALNNNSLIKLETREKIQKIAEELHYVPNFSARSLVNQKNYMIGLFFSSIDKGTSSSFLVDAITGINSVLDESYTLSVKGIDELQHLGEINFQRYDGIIVMSQSDSDSPFIEYVQKQGIPLVVLNRQIDDETIVNVSTNDAEGVEKAVDYALQLGHRRIGYIGGKESFRSSRERRQGLLDSLKKHELPVAESLLFVGDYSMESGFHEMEKILQLGDVRPTFVFCANDDMAIGAMRAVNEAGLHVPEDISLAGFDDIAIVNYLSPPLTTVHKPIKRISRKGTELLLSLIDGEELAEHHYRLQTSLKIRKSVVSLSQ